MELERRAESAWGWAEVAGLGAELLLNPENVQKAATQQRSHLRWNPMTLALVVVVKQIRLLSGNIRVRHT